MLDLHKMMSFPDLLTLNKGDQLNVDFSADSLSSGFDFPGANVGNVYYESYGYIYSSDFKMVHYDDNTKKFIYVPVSTNITLSDDKQSFQKIVCDFELDNKKYHMVFDYQQDNGLILTEKYSYDNNQTPFILDLDKKINTGSDEEPNYTFITNYLYYQFKEKSIFALQSAVITKEGDSDSYTYTTSEALALLKAVIDKRPIFGKMGFQLNPSAPYTVEQPSIFPIYYEKFGSSPIRYIDDNNFGFGITFYINANFGGNNASLGYNRWGIIPFNITFNKVPNNDLVYLLQPGFPNSTDKRMLMQPMLDQLLNVNPEMIDCDLLNVQEGGSLRVKMSNDTWNTILKGYSAWTVGSQVSFNLIQFRYTTDDGLSIPYTFKIDKGEQGSEQEDIMTGVTIEYQYQGKINILKFVQDPDNPHEQDNPDGNLDGVMGHLNFILQSRDIYDVSSSGKRLYLGQIDVTGNFAPGTPTYNIQNIKELFNYIQSASEEDDINAIYTKMDSKDAQLGYFITDNGSYRVTFFVDRQNSFYANAGESGFYIYIPGDLDNVIAVLTADQESGALPLAEVSLIQRGFANGGRVKLNVDNIEKFGEEAVNDSDITNPSNILHYAIQDAITVSEASGNVSYKESSLLKDICDYVINNDIRRGYFYTNIALGGGSGPEYKTQFFVDYDVIFTSNDSGNLYNKVVKIYSPLNEGKNPSLAVYINEYGIVNIETNNLGFGTYLINFDPSKNDGEYNAFQINYSSLYDKTRFVFVYNSGDETGNVDQKIYYLHFNNVNTFAKNDVIFSLYNDTNKSIEIRINEATISIASYEEITFQYLTMGPDRSIYRLYVSNVNPMN